MDNELIRRIPDGKACVYCIRNLINNKSYVGSSIRINNRFYRHRNLLRTNKHYSKELQLEWNVHGEKSFEFHILEHPDHDLLIQTEQLYIDKFKAFGYGYNTLPFAGTAKGSKQKKETIEKRASKLRGRKYTEEHRKKISEKARERILNNEEYKKFVLSNIHSPESKRKSALSRIGFRHSAESIERMRNSLKGRKVNWKNPLERAKKISESRTGYVMPEETKQKLSRINKGVSKISDAIKSKIKELYADGHTRVEIAGIVGIHRHTVGHIISGRVK